MSIEETIYAALSPLVDGRVYPRGTVLQDTPRPFITYLPIGGRPVPALCGGGQTNRNSVMQFDVWCEPPPHGEGAKQALELMRSAEALLNASPIYGWTRSEPSYFHDPVTKTDGVSQDISFWWAP